MIDLGDRVVMRPAGDDPIGELSGKYASDGPSTDAVRRDAHLADVEAEHRKTR